MKKFYSLIICAIMAMASMTASADWYLLGGDNGWSTSNDWKFTDNGDGTFVLLNKTITSQFKIGDGTWGNDVTFGGGGAITVGSTYQLYNPGGNIVVSCALTCSKITFNPTAKTLYLEGEQAKFEVTSDIYIRGAITGTDWPAVDEWKFTKESEYVYTLTDKKYQVNLRLPMPTGALSTTVAMATVRCLALLIPLFRVAKTSISMRLIAAKSP